MCYSCYVLSLTEFHRAKLITPISVMTCYDLLWWGW